MVSDRLLLNYISISDVIMETQQLIVHLPQPLLHKAEQIAHSRALSLPALVADLLTELVEHEIQYTAARQRQLAWLEQGLSLGTNGVIPWTREELHERR